MIATQVVEILRHLRTGKSITPIYAMEKFRCFRLGARIWDLKQDGHIINKDMVKTPSGKHVASYTLVRHD